MGGSLHIVCKQDRRQRLLHPILMPPWTRSETQAQAFLEEILSLPYHEEMREHFQ